MAIATGNFDMMRLVSRTFTESQRINIDSIEVAIDFHQGEPLRYFLNHADEFTRQLSLNTAVSRRAADALLIARGEGMGIWSRPVHALGTLWRAGNSIHLESAPKGFGPDSGWMRREGREVEEIASTTRAAVAMSDVMEIAMPPATTTVSNGTFTASKTLRSLHLFQGVVNIADGTCGVRVVRAPLSSYRGCFSSCANLSRVVFPGDGLLNIGDFAFIGCTFLSVLSLPTSVTRLGHRCFEGCDSLTSVALPSRLGGVTSFVFAHCPSLDEVRMAQGFQSVGEGWFHGCRSLRRLELPDSLRVIGRKAFEACAALTSLCLPMSVVKVGECAFAGCIGLVDLVVTSNLTEFEGSVFENCTGLVEVTLPSDLKIVGGRLHSAFLRVVDVQRVNLKGPTVSAAIEAVVPRMLASRGTLVGEGFPMRDIGGRQVRPWPWRHRPPRPSGMCVGDLPLIDWDAGVRPMSYVRGLSMRANGAPNVWTPVTYIVMRRKFENAEWSSICEALWNIYGIDVRPEVLSLLFRKQQVRTSHQFWQPAYLRG
jgi:hypothetical protein